MRRNVWCVKRDAADRNPPLEKVGADRNPPLEKVGADRNPTPRRKQGENANYD